MKTIIHIFIFLLFSGRIFSQELPPKNKAIVEFCESSKGKKLGKGECWDLAQQALDKVDATWVRPYEFGKLLGKKDLVLPGDVIQFEKVKIVNEDEGWQQLPHHTAIIVKVLAPGKYIVAEQNNNNKKIVQFNEINLNNVKKGKYMIYRPQ